MPETKLSDQEARLVALLRAIKTFDQPELISVEDVGDALSTLDTVVDVDLYEKEHSLKEIGAFFHGYVAGLGATRVPQLIQEHYERASELPPYSPPPEADDRAPYTGGPTGGVVENQGEDPDLVTQTGVRQDGMPESK